MEERSNEEDPYGFMLDLSRVSTSQEQLLHRTPFVGDTPHSPLHDTPSPLDADLPVASAPILMASPPDTQDVFHTPPEESSLPSSDDLQRRAHPVDVDVDRCAVNQAVDVDAGTQGFVDLGGFSDGLEFVDLGRDSELGFSEAHLTQEIDAELVADCSHGDGLGEIPECGFDEFGDLERELSDLGESPVKKLKLSEQNSLGVQLQRVEEGMGNCDEGKLVSDADTEESPCNFEEDVQPQENVPGCEQVPVDAGNEDNFCREISMDKNLDTQVVQLETVTSAGEEGNKSSDEVMEGSRICDRSDEDPGLRVLPFSIRSRLENAANELASGKGREKNKCPVFYVLKVLSENTHEVEDNLGDVSLLEAANLSDITFPRPRWWPDNYDFDNQRTE